MKRSLLVVLSVCAWFLPVAAQESRAKNVVLFLADAAGIPTINAASRMGYGAPQRLFVQRLPFIGLSDTSTASEWVTDSAAGMTAIVTGVKTHNGVIAQGPDAVRGTNCVILAPIAVYNGMTTTLKALTTVLTNGISTNVYGMTVETVTATNANHAPGFGLGYVLNMGGRRVYMAGDTGNIPPIRALTNIDVAFLCMNSFTMTPSEATNAVRSFRPVVVYPYHYQNGSVTTNAAYFKQILGLDAGTEVRLRKWY